ncbi:MAG: lytic transglycosylase domain-containing protein [Bacillota bacterium]
MKNVKQYIWFILMIVVIELALALGTAIFFGDEIMAFLDNRYKEKVNSEKKIALEEEKEKALEKEKEKALEEEKRKALEEEKRKALEEEKKKALEKENKIDMEKEKKSTFDWSRLSAAWKRWIDKLKLPSFHAKANQEKPAIDPRIESIKEMTDLSDKGVEAVLYYHEKTGVPISMVLAVIEQESNFDKNAVGKSQDRGLMQIIPETEAWLCSKFGETYGIVYDKSRIFEEDYNIGLGTIYLGHLMKAYPDNYHRIFTEYNRGYYKAKDYFVEHNTYKTQYSQSVLEKMKKYEVLDGEKGENNR